MLNNYINDFTIITMTNLAYLFF